MKNRENGSLTYVSYKIIIKNGGIRKLKREVKVKIMEYRAKSEGRYRKGVDSGMCERKRGCPTGTHRSLHSTQHGARLGDEPELPVMLRMIIVVSWGGILKKNKKIVRHNKETRYSEENRVSCFFKIQ